MTRTPEITRSASLSACRRYRYTLTRSWYPELPTVVFVGLNPSTADAQKDDPTVRRCLGFARDWGFGNLVLINLFALRATDPEMLHSARNPVGQENDAQIAKIVEDADTIVAAWGAHGGLLERDRRVLNLLPKVLCLGRTKEGFPRHPLYLSKTTALEAFSDDNRA